MLLSGKTDLETCEGRTGGGITPGFSNKCHSVVGEGVEAVNLRNHRFKFRAASASRVHLVPCSQRKKRGAFQYTKRER